MTITAALGTERHDTLDPLDTLGSLAGLAAAYGVTSRLLLAPVDGPLVAKLREPGLFDTWPVRRCCETMRGLSSMRRWLHGEDDAASVAADHARLFTGSAPVIPPPFESAYRPTERITFDLPAIDVRDPEHVFGLAVPAPGHRTGDHLGLELAYAGRLCLGAAEAAARGDGAAAQACLAEHHTFLDTHLMRWVPGCLREVEAAATTHLYRGAAALALGVVVQAHEFPG